MSKRRCAASHSVAGSFGLLVAYCIGFVAKRT